MVTRHSPHILDDAFRAHTELAYEGFSHRASNLHGQVSLSRIDRGYTNLTPLVLLDSYPQVKALHDIMDINYCSDHIPIGFVMFKPLDKPPPNPMIPESIARHQLYAYFLQGLIGEHTAADGFALELSNKDKWQLAKKLMLQARDLVKVELAEASPNGLQQQLAVPLRVHRAHRAGQVRVVREERRTCGPSPSTPVSRATSSTSRASTTMSRT